MTQLEIPSMGGTEIGDHLRQYAEGVPAGQCIVEVGVWLGAGTYHLCKGALANIAKPSVHCFDRWTASAEEVEKAAKKGLSLKLGENLEPHVRRYIQKFSGELTIKFNRSELADISAFKGPEIGLYVDDASKRKAFAHSMDVFKSKFAKGAILMLMDFYFYQSRPNDVALLSQKEYMDGNRQFEFIKRVDDSYTAVYRYLG